MQDPMVRQIGHLLASGTIGRVNHVRVEMMADPVAPFGPRRTAKRPLVLP